MTWQNTTGRSIVGRISGKDQHLPAPADLSDRMEAFWTWAVATFELEQHDLLRLEEACRAFDRAEQARQVANEKGLVYRDSRDNPRQRPEVKIELDSRNQAARLLRELGLDAADLPEAPRMPRTKDYGRRA